VDEWPGENYDGTSVRAAAKYLQKTGKIKSYYWAFDVNTLTNTVLNVAPVVVGTYWFYNMFYPDRNGLIRATGQIAGGHAYVINGVDTIKKQFRIKNSWGKTWGQGGHAFISFSDMDKLIKLNGEICLATENNF
jgi:C1A family cysteine protease